MPKSRTRAESRRTVRGSTPLRISGSKNVVAPRPRSANSKKGEFPIVGIGASAGGLEALRTLMQELGSETGMAFVVVQHLDPAHDSMLHTILGGDNGMPVTEAEDQTVVQPNCVYVIKPNAHLTILDGVLRSTTKRPSTAPLMTIDRFFQTLARDSGASAIGIVLSGMGNDGTRGLEAIHAAGGLTFAQDERSSRFFEMPRHAIESGAADFVLSPEQISQELIRITVDGYVGAKHRTGKPSLITDDARNRILALLRRDAGIDFSYYRKGTFDRGVIRRMSMGRFQNAAAYIDHLESTPAECGSLSQDVLIHVTGFFRDPLVFEALKPTAASLLANRQEPLRVWVAGCATGEEVYSIAMLLLECLPDEGDSIPIQIFGTDVSAQAVKKARAGIYKSNRLKGVSPERLKRFFALSDDGYHVSKSIRDMCLFTVHQLGKDPPFSRIDLISCRNVLIYMNPSVRRQAMGVFHYALKPGGILLLGGSESVESHTQLFKVVDRKNNIFARNATPRGAANVTSMLVPTMVPAQAVRSGPVDPKSEADRLILDKFSPAGFIVDSDFKIVHFHRDLAPYLHTLPGPPSVHMLKLLRPELNFEVRELMTRSAKSGHPSQKKHVTFAAESGARQVDILVAPLSKQSGEPDKCLVLFHRLTDPRAPSDTKVSGPRSGVVAKLKAELASTRGYLQAMIADRDASNDQLRASNEDIVFSNEELQSTIEELETAKEELQSSNEEMITLNDELNDRNVELGGFADDLTNLLTSVNIPILILDLERRIRRFTPSAKGLLNLLPTDVGRPFSDLHSNIDISNWSSLIDEVSISLHVLKREVQDRTGRWHSLRIQPYRTADNRIEGVVIALFDIDQLKRTIDEVTAAREFAQAVVATVHEPLLVLDDTLTVLQANAMFCDTFKVSRDKTEGLRLSEIPGHDWDLPELQEALANILPYQESFEDFEVDHFFKETGRKILLLNAREVHQKDSGKRTILLAMHDITARRAAEEQVQDALTQSEATVTAILRASAQAIIAVNPAGQIVLANLAAEEMFGFSIERLSSMSMGELLPTLSDRNPHGVRTNGSEFPVEVSITHLQTKTGPLAISLITDISERRTREENLRRTASELRQNRKTLRALTARLISAREEETQHLARELHDDFGQRLAVLAMELATMSDDPNPEIPRHRQNLELAVAEARKLVDDLQSISRRLHPSIIDDLGLEAALRSECLSTTEQFKIPVQLTANQVPHLLAREVSLCVYRVVQEALRNMIKHAQATAAHVAISTKQDAIVLTVQDNGIGFDALRAKGRGGLGLVSMEERARLVGGTFHIKSSPLDGTEVRITVPLKKALA